MNVNNLVIEITRRCNAQCEHCLRGDAQNVDINNKVIDAMLEGVNFISHVAFTGGEPSLAVPKIKYFLKVIKERNIGLGSFYVVTNDKVKSLKLALALIELYDYCDNNDEMTGLCISKDQFHEYEIDSVSEADKLYRSLSFYRPDERSGQLRPDFIISEGRALINGLGNRTKDIEEIYFELNEDEDTIDYIDNTVYVNALGDIIPGCDFSFETQEKIKIGNVLNNTIEEIFLNAREKVAP